MAGVPLAGLVACASLSAVTKKAQTRLVEAGLIINFDTAGARSMLDPGGCMHWPSHMGVSNVGIVDDDVYVALCDPCDVTGAMAIMATVMFEEYTRAGLTLHHEVAKTAGLITWFGKGRIAAQREFELSAAEHKGVPFKVFGQTHTLPVTTVYKHVGCMIKANSRHGIDVACKCGEMRKAAHSLKKHVLTNEASTFRPVLALCIRTCCQRESTR